MKPNFRTLGPRFGKAMPQVAAAVEALDPGHVAEAIRGERRIGVNVDGSEHALEPDDMTLVMQPLEGYEVEAEAGRAVALALELDDELVREGLAREIVHAVQNARKQAGLDVSDRIALTLGGDDGADRGRALTRGLHRRRDAGDLGRLRRRRARRRGLDRGPRAGDRDRAEDLRPYARPGQLSRPSPSSSSSSWIVQISL